jgi:FMN-dependent NADH-azoreductase
MTTLLHLDSSGKGSQSVTRPLTKYFVESWTANDPKNIVIERDLMTSDLHFVDEQTVGAFFTPEDKQSDSQKQALKLSNQFINELQTADVWVFGIPMYNFAVPAVFKAYIDLIVRAGKTFSYAGGTPKGLMQDKKLYIITASGADYSTEPYKALDFVEPYLRAIFGFIGITEITVIKSHGHDPETIARNSEEAKQKIDALLRSVAQPVA